MIESYQKVLEMESVAILKLEQDRRALEKVRKALYQEKDFVINKLITHLKEELGINYYRYKVIDIDYNVADILVKSDSLICKEYITDKDFLKFNVEYFIDNRMFDNKDEIIIIDLNFDENLLNLGYLCDSLSYNYLSYSKELAYNLSIFVNYLINKNI